VSALANVRKLSALIHVAVVPLAALFAYALATHSKTALMPVGAVLAIGVLAMVFSAPPQAVFLFWFACAPFLQDSSRTSTVGHFLSQVLYTVPPLLFLFWACVSRRSGIRASIVDVLPIAYFLFVLVSLLATRVPPAPSVRGVLTTVGIAVVAYYFCAFGPVTRDLPFRLCRLLLATAVILAVMALIEEVSGWNLWHNEAWQKGQPRVVATLDNPAVLGTYFAIAIVVGIIVLAWEGPRSLRRLSIAAIVLCAPAIVFTYTRGPVLALLVVAAPLLLLRRSIRVKSVIGLAIVGIVVGLLWGSFANSRLYQQRVSDAATVQTRVIIQNWSIKLFSQKPVLGWGYGSFDRVKNSADFQATAIEETLGTSSTSHDTFLTILVETGGVGLLMFLGPWFVVGRQLVVRTLAGGSERWTYLMCLAIAATFAISATTFDMRFFSFASALPWIAVGLGRRLVGRPT
jgi:O-antigen ligase